MRTSIIWQRHEHNSFDKKCTYLKNKEGEARSQTFVRKLAWHLHFLVLVSRLRYDWFSSYSPIWQIKYRSNNLGNIYHFINMRDYSQQVYIWQPFNIIYAPFYIHYVMVKVFLMKKKVWNENLILLNVKPLNKKDMSGLM